MAIGAATSAGMAIDGINQMSKMIARLKPITAFSADTYLPDGMVWACAHNWGRFGKSRGVFAQYSSNAAPCCSNIFFSSKVMTRMWRTVMMMAATATIHGRVRHGHPSDEMREPKYNGLRVTAYGPPVISVCVWTARSMMTRVLRYPDAHERKNAPMSVTAT